MKTYSRATLLGHVGNDVVLRYTQTGKPVVNLSLATNERRREGPEVTTWHRVVLWDKLAELAQQYVLKGEPVYVEGPLSSRQWTDKDGNTHWQTEMTARELIFLGGRSNSPEGERASTSTAEPTNGSPGIRSAEGEELGETVQDIPF